MLRTLIAVTVILFATQDASAWPFRAKAVSVTRTRTVTRFAGTPQQVAQSKASYMAERGLRGHVGGGFAGCVAEGTGRGATAAIALANCCFTGTRKCAAAAVVKGKNGVWYAVKLFW